MNQHRLQILSQEREMGVWREPAPLTSLQSGKSLIEEDIRAKIEAYLRYQVPMDELLGFLDNPHLLWEVLAQAVCDPAFYEFARRLHQITAFYTESSRIPECEIYPLLAKLLATT